MGNIRIFVLLLIVFIIIDCARIQAENIDGIIHRDKRLLFGCAKSGSKCSGLFGKSCCHGLVCNTTFKKCVRRGSGTSWLNDRNGK